MYQQKKVSLYSFGYKEYYYLFENGKLYNQNKGKFIRLDKHHRYNIILNNGTSQRTTLKPLYKKVFNKEYC